MLLQKLILHSRKNGTSIFSMCLFIPTFFLLINLTLCAVIYGQTPRGIDHTYSVIDAYDLDRIISWNPFLIRLSGFWGAPISSSHGGRLILSIYTVSFLSFIASVASVVAFLAFYERKSLYKLDLEIIEKNLFHSSATSSRNKSKLFDNWMLFSIVILVFDFLFGAVNMNSRNSFGNIVQWRDADLFRWAIELWVIQILSLVMFYTNRLERFKHHA